MISPWRSTAGATMLDTTAATWIAVFSYENVEFDVKKKQTLLEFSGFISITSSFGDTRLRKER